MTETTLSLLIALFSVLGTLAPQISKLVWRHSDTRISIVSGDDTNLTVAASNSGPRSSSLRTYHIDFGSELLPAMDLERVGSSPLVPPEKEAQVKLRPVQVPLSTCQKKSLARWLESGVVELTVEVQESSDAIGRMSPRRDRIAAKYLSTWINGLISWKEGPA